MVVAALTLSLALMVGTAVVGDVTDGQEGIREDESTAVLLGNTGQFVSIADAEGFEETVYNSRGKAVNLTGADDSYVESKSNYKIASDDTWTVSLWARVDNESGSQTMTALSVNGRLVVNYNGTDGNWTAWYYDESSTSSWQVNVSAPDQPQNLTNVQVWSNGTHLTIYRNTTQGDIVNITGDNIESAPVTSENWDGRLDEVRTFDDAINSTTRSELHNTPIAPQNNTNRTSRIMFDQADKSTQLIFFTDTRLEQSNVTFSQGLPGEQMDAKSLLVMNPDYEWDTSGPKIKPLDGGQLDGAPVAYVDYQYEGALSKVVDSWSNAVGLAALIPMAGIALLILRRLQGV
jgi:hypothetical protein